MTYLFSSESVSEGHPDKLCDQISDAILDEALRQDPQSRVAVETYTTTGLVLVGGEVNTTATLDIQKIVRETLRDIGYTDVSYGISADSCSILTALHEQSADIAQGVNEGEGLDTALGAGDQGIMFGYACKQTPVYMPLPIYLSHELLKQLTRCRKSGRLKYLRPDAKAQVTVEYEGKKPISVHTIVISTQHAPDVDQKTIQEDVIREVIQPIIPEHLLSDKVRILINPTGRFVIGGPHGDAGLTGRKIIVDTYGGWARHGGGAFSGKDATKVDRSAAYMARYIAKNLVAAGVAEEIEIQLAYAIGISKPVSINVETYGTSEISHEKILDLINMHFELTPSGIIRTLELRRPIFKATAAYGHFGRGENELSWEALDKVKDIQASLAHYAQVA